MEKYNEMSLVEWCGKLLPQHKVNKELNLVRETLDLLVNEYLDLEKMPMHRMLVTESIEVLKRTDNKSLNLT